jgi:CheY-like chemotaxis protein
VDDDPTNRRLASLLLDKFGYQVDAVDNGVDALAALSSALPMTWWCWIAACRPWTATKSPRPSGPGNTACWTGPIPILALTADAVDENRERAFAAGDGRFPRQARRRRSSCKKKSAPCSTGAAPSA